MAGDPESQLRLTSSSTAAGISNMVHPVDNDEAAHEATSASENNQVVYRDFKKWKSWLVPAFVVANVVMLVITMYVNDCPNNSDSCFAKFLGRFSFQPLKENPLLGPSSLTLQKIGALDVNKVVHEQQGWRLITCMWLHAGVFHLLANMLSLLVIGIRLEQECGFVRIGLLYLISGLGGSVLSALFLQSGISAGASGAVFGLLGGMLSELLTNWTVYAQKVAALLTLIVIVAINLAIGILPQVDNFAHIGGFVSGFLLGFVLLVKPQFGWVRQRYGHSGDASVSSKPKYNFFQYTLWVFSAMLLIVGFTIGLIMVFRGFDANDHCSWCHYMSCVPTKRWSCKTDPVYCMTSQIDNQLNITCSDSGKITTFMLSNASNSRIHGLCIEICR